MKYLDYEADVIDAVANELQCPNGDAQGVIEASPVCISECMFDGMSADETADRIIDRPREVL